MGNDKLQSWSSQVIKTKRLDIFDLDEIKFIKLLNIIPPCCIYYCLYCAQINSNLYDTSVRTPGLSPQAVVIIITLKMVG